MGAIAVTGASVDQLQCTDNACLQACKETDFPENACIPNLGGGSGMFLQCDSSGARRLRFTTSDCSGQGTQYVDPVGTCVYDPSGGISYLNSCQSGIKGKGITQSTAMFSAASVMNSAIAVTGASVDQLQCTDNACSQACKETDFPENACIQELGGGSGMFL